VGVSVLPRAIFRERPLGIAADARLHDTTPLGERPHDDQDSICDVTQQRGIPGRQPLKRCARIGFGIELVTTNKRPSDYGSRSDGGPL
jgi:hypothetical protein